MAGAKMNKRSEELFQRAIELMPGGVSSPVRAFGAVGGNPLFMASGSGSTVTDVDGNVYIDMLGSWGPLILGHSDPGVAQAVSRAASQGTSFGAPTPGELELARLIVDALPSVDMVRFVSSGTEATMSALRLARASTGRSKILKFAGCYHGHVDSLLVAAGSGPATLGLPDSPGVPPSSRADTVVATYNSVDSVAEAFEVFGEDIAAVIVEPVAANMGVIPPQAGFLEALRETCTERSALLIFDEVVTGFRVGPQGAQGMYRVHPDLTVLGKVIGGGLPIGAYGGRRDLMERIAPAGDVYQAGTLSGNPLSVAAGIATVSQLSDADPYWALERLGARLEEGLVDAAKEAGVPIAIHRVGSMLTVFFTDKVPFDFTSAKLSDTKRFASFFHLMLEEGVYWPPSQFEAAFVSRAHSTDDIDRVITAARRAFERI